MKLTKEKLEKILNSRILYKYNPLFLQFNKYTAIIKIIKWEKGVNSKEVSIKIKTEDSSETMIFNHVILEKNNNNDRLIFKQVNPKKTNKNTVIRSFYLNKEEKLIQKIKEKVF